MTVGSQKYYTGHTAVGRAFRKSQWPNPTNIRRGSAPQRGTPCCSFRIGESPTLQMLEFPAESPLAVRRCRFAVAPSPQRAGSKLARVQPFKCSQQAMLATRLVLPQTHRTKKSPPPAVRAWPSSKPKPRGRARRLRLRLSLRLCLVDEASPSANPKSKILGG
jgi:hypothetical protein